MNEIQLRSLLEQVKSDNLSIEEAIESMATYMEVELGDAVIDHQRKLRVGNHEVVYGEGKTAEQLVRICVHLANQQQNVLVTRVDANSFNEVHTHIPEANYNAVARTITIVKEPEEVSDKGYIAIVAAGTSDMPVVEEAYETAVYLGNRVEKIIDVGVAGIHRLMKRLDIIRGARVVIVVAGMEGALASVVGGLVDKPVIAVPTSVGYGASFNGLSALLTMLNSCASGVSVVNIDNGFGAAYCASQINRL